MSGPTESKTSYRVQVSIFNKVLDWPLARNTKRSNEIDNRKPVNWKLEMQRVRFATGLSGN